MRRLGAAPSSTRRISASRAFNLVWVAANHGTGVEVTATADQTVKCDGSAVTVSPK
jgi:hypothetical protein